MSAINGIFERRGNAISEAAFNLSLNALSQYGLDGSDYWLSPTVAFGHQKTFLFSDEETEKNPFYESEPRLAITSTARLDNRPELCLSLGIPQNEQNNLSDSQIILKAWQKWGRSCPQHLIGDYAFAIWDEREQSLFCVRDHIGVIPFYYHLSKERFIFASDIKGILAVPGVSDDLDGEIVIASIADKLFYHLDRTYFSSIRRLPPGHTLTVKKDSERIERYWFPEKLPKIRFSNDEDYPEAAREVLTRAVNDRLRTEKKVGVHASGGLDSSGIVVLANRRRGEQGLAPPEAFVWQPPPEDFNNLEREFAQIEAVCQQENLSPVYCPASAVDFLETLKKDPATEPISTTIRLERTIQKQARQRNVRLILSGWGGDEGLSFNGRGFHSELLLRGRFLQFFKESQKHQSPLGFLAYEILLLMFSDRYEGQRKLKNRSLQKQKKISPYLHSDLQNKVKLRTLPCRQSSIKSTMLWLWKQGWLAERMESWMALGSPLNIKYAYPLLDRRLMEFVIGLPRDQFIKDDWRRWIMRKTLDGIVPPEIAWQPNKDEPVRVTNSKLTTFRALELAEKEIASNGKTYSRAKYLDIDLLLKDIKPENLAKRPKTGNILRALQFLDF